MSIKPRIRTQTQEITLPWYQHCIIQAVRHSAFTPERAADVEAQMRLYHPTLDHLTKNQFDVLARRAWVDLLNEERDAGVQVANG